LIFFHRAKSNCNFIVIEKKIATVFLSHFTSQKNRYCTTVHST
jgi:hypothetical protein